MYIPSMSIMLFNTWRFTYVKSKCYGFFAAFGATKKILFSDKTSAEVDPVRFNSCSSKLLALFAPGWLIISRILNESTDISCPFNANVSVSKFFENYLVT